LAYWYKQEGELLMTIEDQEVRVTATIRLKALGYSKKEK